MAGFCGHNDFLTFGRYLSLRLSEGFKGLRDPAEFELTKSLWWSIFDARPCTFIDDSEPAVTPVKSHPRAKQDTSHVKDENQTSPGCLPFKENGRADVPKGSLVRDQVLRQLKVIALRAAFSELLAATACVLMVDKRVKKRAQSARVWNRASSSGSSSSALR
eukprot:3304078-Amphidinium_carterae.1